MTLADLIQPVSPIAAAEQVTDAQLARYAALIYRRTGIRVSPQKKTLLSNRLRRRLRETKIESFEAYYRRLGTLRADDPEWDAFFQEITTHETYLFRDEAQWNWFSREYLPERAEAARLGGRRSLRIWSAACSTGDEPMTIACCAAACLPNPAQWNVQILATDIGAGTLEQARAGEFGERAMRCVPEDYRRRFFAKAKDAPVWHARPALARWIVFRRHNLMERLPDSPFDLVFLKNVLIYFDAESKRTVLGHVTAAIKPEGLLVVGAAEGIGDLLQGFARLRPWLYCKPRKHP